MSLLSVTGLGKAFRTYSSEWQRFGRWLGLEYEAVEEHWVLRDISFEVDSGEAIGIIGHNGAGKSTLLKLVTGTLKPTEGCFSVAGRVSAILELGMGFNPDLSGRQNARHSASIMGFTAEQIDGAIGSIEAFAELDDYFEEPVRTYSSGMQMRLAFAVATAWRPEILIVDEALSVGDAYFQHKSFKRIREFQDQGTTLLLVSHDRTAIQSLCSRAILLEQGRIIKDGNPETVFDYYNALIAEKEGNTISVKQLADGKIQTKSGTGEASVREIVLLGKDGLETEVVGVGDKVCLRVTVDVNRDLDSLVLGYSIKDRLGQVIYGTNTWHTRQALSDCKAGGSYVFMVSFLANFGVGSYSVQTALVDADTHLTANFEWCDMALVFEVANYNKVEFIGLSWNEPVIKITESN